MAYKRPRWADRERMSLGQARGLMTQAMIASTRNLKGRVVYEAVEQELGLGDYPDYMSGEDLLELVIQTAITFEHFGKNTPVPDDRNPLVQNMRRNAALMCGRY